MSFDVAAWHPSDSNAVIEATKLFTTDVAELNLRQSGVRVRRMDPARSVVDRARSFPRNVEISALQTFEVDSVPGPAGGPPNRSLNSITMLMNYSMVLLPDQPMMARLCDDRVGYFNITFENFDEVRVMGPERCFIKRTSSKLDRKSTRLNSSHVEISYAVFCLKKKTHNTCKY